MLKQRVLAALVGIPIVIYSIYSGGLLYFIVISLIALFGLSEFLGMINNKYFVSPKFVLYTTSILLLLIQYIYPQNLGIGLILIFLIYGFMLVLMFPELTPEELVLNLWGITYIIGCISFLLPLRSLNNGMLYSIFLFVGIWVNDTGAYFTGLNFGKRKLAFKVSPKKTIEGALGGIIITILFLVGLAHFFNIEIMIAILLAIVISISGLIGDLVISAFKRHFNIKDSGKIIPGHGGVLDRFDSIIFATPIFYILLIYLI